MTVAPTYPNAPGLKIGLDAETRDWITSNSDKRWQQFLDYWERLCRAYGRLPARSEIDPLGLAPAIWRNLFLVDVIRRSENKPRFRMRLLGTAIVEAEATRVGAFIDEFTGDQAEPMTKHYLDCIEGRLRIRRTTLVWSDPDKEHVDYRVLLLPLAAENGEIDTLLGLSVYD